MNYSRVVQHENRIAAVLALAASVDVGVQAQLARYACVLISGYLEQSLITILGDYASRCCSPRVAQHVKSQLRYFQNPNAEKIVQLIRTFDQVWADEIEAEIEGEIKDAIDSVVANRHLLAHGHDTGVSLGTVGRWMTAAKKMPVLLAQRTANV